MLLLILYSVKPFVSRQSPHCALTIEHAENSTQPRPALHLRDTRLFISELSRILSRLFLSEISKLLFPENLKLVVERLKTSRIGATQRRHSG